MEPGMVATAAGAVLTTVFLAALFWRRASAQQDEALAREVVRTRELEKQLHLKERDFLAERNHIEIAHAETIRISRSESFEEGRQLGIAEGSTAHINELASQRSELVAKFDVERERAVAEARDKLRAEYELQTKLFTVKISPYVRITEDKGLIRDTYETVAGYQYQLLVNGIPAFSPHVVAERTETKRAVNEELERMLIQTAQNAAEAAVQLYLGGSPQFAKVAPPLLERLTKK